MSLSDGYIILILIGISAEKIIIAAQPVPIISSSNPNIFPQSWHSESINAQAEVLLDKEEIERSKHILNRAIAKYPLQVINENLSTIYVLHRLKYNGISASGTNSKRNIYIANRGISEGFTDFWIEETFHNEFSSILLRNFPEYLMIEKWKSINEPSFQYGTSGVIAVKKGKSSKKGEPYLYRNGFLHMYATSTIENDFNSVAGNLFMGSKDFWSIVDQYGRIRCKVTLAIQFYSKINPIFTEEYFRSLQNID